MTDVSPLSKIRLVEFNHITISIIDNFNDSNIMFLDHKSCYTLEFDSLPGSYQQISYVVDVDKKKKEDIQKNLNSIRILKSSDADKAKSVSKLLELHIPNVVGLCFKTAFTRVNR